MATMELAQTRSLDNSFSRVCKSKNACPNYKWRRLQLVAFIFTTLFCLIYSQKSWSIALVGPGTTTICNRSSSTPVIDANSSDASVVGVLRVQSEGAFLTQDADHAWQGFGFIPLIDTDVTITVPSIVFDGLLVASGVGSVNHAEVKIKAQLNAGGTELASDIVHDRNHTTGGPSADSNLFSPVDAHLEHAVEGGIPHSVIIRVDTEVFGTGSRADFLTGSEQGVGGRRVSFGCILVETNIADVDADGIPDVWEEEGFGDLDLSAMGATVDQKDIFVEIDWLPGRGPTQASVRAVKEAFAAAPLSNPDGSEGIRLHVDTGDLTDPMASEDDAGPGTCGDGINNNPGADDFTDTEDPDCLVGDLVFSSLAGGEALGNGEEISLASLPNGTGLADLVDDLDGNGRSDFYEVRATNFDFDFRLFTFHYGISAENLAVGGQAELGGANFILGSKRASVLMHELGHNLGLQHGGNEADVVPETDGEEGNCKPNYVSIMNYNHSQNGGIPVRGFGTGQDLDGDGALDGKIVDFSPPRLQNGGRGQAALPTLNEDALNNAQILDTTDPDNRFMFIDPTGQLVLRRLNQAAQWSNGAEADGPININTSNTDGQPEACTNNRTDDTLTGFNDWENIVLGLRGSGDTVAGPFNPTTEPEPTDQDINDFITKVNTVDLGIELTHSPELSVAGQSITYTITVTNHGPNPAYDVQVTDTLPPNLEAINLPSICEEGLSDTVTCKLGELESEDIATIELQARIALDNDCKGRNRVIINNEVKVINQAGPDPVPENNTASDQAEVLCVKYEYAAQVLCGTQPDLTDFRLATGLYATSINIHNPYDGEISFFKKLALSFPPEKQQAGLIIPIAVDSLQYDEALKTDCNELRRLIPDSIAESASYFEGFVVVQSPTSLDVTGVYTTAAVNPQGVPTGHSSIDVNSIVERKREIRTDLSVTKSAQHQGGTSPIIRYTVKVANEGSASAENIVVIDDLDMQSGTLTTLEENTFETTHGSGWAVQSIDSSNARLRAEITSLAPGDIATLVFEINALIDLNSGRTQVDNRVTVESSTIDKDVTNNSFFLEIDISLR